MICRRIRSLSVRAELVPHDIDPDKLHNVKGIILSGGPSSVHEAGSPKPNNAIFSMNVPVLGICYGHQIIVEEFGGDVLRANKEYGSSDLLIDNSQDLLGGIGQSMRAWMSHGDEAKSIPKGFEIIAHTSRSKAAAIADIDRKIYGVQFHPEVNHTEHGNDILGNFALGICGAQNNWTMESFIEQKTAELAKLDGNVLCGVSGGVDSTVAATLIHKAIGNRLRCVFVDTGLLREGESDDVTLLFNEMKMDLESIDAADSFLERLKGVTDPEEKRHIIGDEFIKIFSNAAKSGKKCTLLAQGTLYPDVIESGSVHGPARVIKSHHNVGGLPGKLGMTLVEPLRDLYKDEVRIVGKLLGLDDRIILRHPFPGPGLSVRIMGSVTPEKLTISRKASKIVEDELVTAGLYDDVWQAYAGVGDDRAVGVVGDGRIHGFVVIVKIVESIDAMTADWSRVPYDILEKISNKITNELDNVALVTFAISSKPPSTIELE